MSYALCRVCLMSKVKMHNISNKKLQETYEKLSGTKLNKQDRKGIKLCYLCYSHLQKSRRFSDLSHKSAKILTSLMDNGVMVTHETIATLNLGTIQTLSVVMLPSTSLNVEDITKITPEAMAMLRLRKVLRLTVATMPPTSLDSDDAKSEVQEASMKEEPIEIESSNDEDVEDDKIKNIEDFAKFLIEQVGTEPTDTAKNLIEQVKTEPTNTTECLIDGKIEPVERIQLHTIKPEIIQSKTENSADNSISSLNCKTIVDEDEENEAYNYNVLSDDEREAKIAETLKRLMDVIEECKPTMYSNYNMQCEIIKKEIEELKLDGMLHKEKRLPKRRFPWCQRSRSLLHQLVKLAGSEQAGALLLASRALPLFPKGFVRIPALMRQANIGKYVPPAGTKRRLDSDSDMSNDNDENDTALESVQNVSPANNDAVIKIEKDTANDSLVDTPNSVGSCNKSSVRKPKRKKYTRRK